MDKTNKCDGCDFRDKCTQVFHMDNIKTGYCNKNRGEE